MLILDADMLFRKALTPASLGAEPGVCCMCFYSAPSGCWITCHLPCLSSFPGPDARFRSASPCKLLTGWG